MNATSTKTQERAATIANKPTDPKAEHRPVVDPSASLPEDRHLDEKPTEAPSSPSENSDIQTTQEESPVTPKSWTRHMRKGLWALLLLVGNVIVTVIVTKIIENPVDRWSEQTLGKAFQEDSKSFVWAANTRWVRSTELAQIRKMRQTKDQLALLRVHARNDSSEIKDVTFWVRFNTPLVAHCIPISGLKVTDDEGRPITDPFRHFSYKQEASFTIHGMPVGAWADIGFFVEANTQFRALCIVDEAPQAPSVWPAELDPNEDLFLVTTKD